MDLGLSNRNKPHSCVCKAKAENGLDASQLFVVTFQNADYMTAQVFDLTDKLEQSEAYLGRSGFVMGVDAAEASEDRLTKATKDRYNVLLMARLSYY